MACTNCKTKTSSDFTKNQWQKVKRGQKATCRKCQATLENKTENTSLAENKTDGLGVETKDLGQIFGVLFDRFLPKIIPAIVQEVARQKVPASRWTKTRFIIKSGQAKTYEAQGIDGQKACLKEYDQKKKGWERLLREAEALKILNGFGTPKIYDQGEEWIALEWLEGGTLSSYREQFITQDPKADKVPIALALVRCLCKIVANMHNKGIIHRDIKPKNLMLKTPMDYESLCLIDFGINYLDGADTLTDPHHQPKTSFCNPVDGTVREPSYDVSCCAAVLLWFIDGRTNMAVARQLSPAINSQLFTAEFLYLIPVIEKALKAGEGYPTVELFLAALENAPKFEVEFKIPESKITSAPEPETALGPEIKPLQDLLTRFFSSECQLKFTLRNGEIKFELNEHKFSVSTTMIENSIRWSLDFQGSTMPLVLSASGAIVNESALESWFKSLIMNKWYDT